MIEIVSSHNNEQDCSNLSNSRDCGRGQVLLALFDPALMDLLALEPLLVAALVGSADQQVFELEQITSLPTPALQLLLEPHTQQRQSPLKHSFQALLLACNHFHHLQYLDGQLLPFYFDLIRFLPPTCGTLHRLNQLARGGLPVLHAPSPNHSARGNQSARGGHYHRISAFRGLPPSGLGLGVSEDNVVGVIAGVFFGLGVGEVGHFSGEVVELKLALFALVSQLLQLPLVLFLRFSDGGLFVGDVFFQLSEGVFVLLLLLQGQPVLVPLHAVGDQAMSTLQLPPVDVQTFPQH